MRARCHLTVRDWLGWMAAASSASGMSVELGRQLQHGRLQVSTRCGQAKQKAVAKLKDMVAVGRRLLPQIKHWLKTGQVAAGKLIHVGLQEARAIVKGKRQVKFGFKWRINRLCGGYVFGRRVAAQADENRQPAGALKDYWEVFGKTATPEMIVYDRGASAAAVAPELCNLSLPKSLHEFSPRMRAAA